MNITVRPADALRCIISYVSQNYLVGSRNIRHPHPANPAMDDLSPTCVPAAVVHRSLLFIQSHLEAVSAALVMDLRAQIFPPSVNPSSVKNSGEWTTSEIPTTCLQTFPLAMTQKVLVLCMFALMSLLCASLSRAFSSILFSCFVAWLLCRYGHNNCSAVWRLAFCWFRVEAALTKAVFLPGEWWCLLLNSAARLI